VFLPPSHVLARLAILMGLLRIKSLHCWALYRRKSAKVTSVELNWWYCSRYILSWDSPTSVFYTNFNQFIYSQIDWIISKLEKIKWSGSIHTLMYSAWANGREPSLPNYVRYGGVCLINRCMWRELIKSMTRVVSTIWNGYGLEVAYTVQGEQSDRRSWMDMTRQLLIYSDL
jgi:hypothetical protein